MDSINTKGLICLVGTFDWFFSWSCFVLDTVHPLHKVWQWLTSQVNVLPFTLLLIPAYNELFSTTWAARADSAGMSLPHTHGRTQTQTQTHRHTPALSNSFTTKFCIKVRRFSCVEMTTYWDFETKPNNLIIAHLQNQKSQQWCYNATFNTV